MRNSNAKSIALCGILAATATVIMCLGGIVPFATYICPVLCCLIGGIVLLFCGKRLAWTWYVSVSLLCLLLAPDREPVIVYLFLGMYPNLKQALEKSKLQLLFKIFYFNLSAITAYWIGANLMGLTETLQEFAGLGLIGLLLILLLANITFLLLDIILGHLSRFKIETRR